jgi:hypothetical protein
MDAIRELSITRARGGNNANLNGCFFLSRIATVAGQTDTFCAISPPKIVFLYRSIEIEEIIIDWTRDFDLKKRINARTLLKGKLLEINHMKIRGKMSGRMHGASLCLQKAVILLLVYKFLSCVDSAVF